MTTTAESSLGGSDPPAASAHKVVHVVGLPHHLLGPPHDLVVLHVGVRVQGLPGAATVRPRARLANWRGRIG